LLTAIWDVFLAVFVMVIETEGSIAPVASRTAPVMVAVEVWENTGVWPRIVTPRTSRMRNRAPFNTRVFVDMQKHSFDGTSEVWEFRARV
jgi:hypothetical protein